MQQIHDLRRIDLNLLVVLDALLSERHVSRAAQRLAMSQPAVSHALGRLRELFGDPLLVRVKSRMQLTSLALELAPKLQAFEPVRSRRHFRLGMSDYGAWVVLPALLRQQQALAPGVSFGIVQEPRLETARQVAEGQLDCALGVFPLLPEGVRARRLFEERFVCVCRRSLFDRPDGLSLDRYLAARHVRVSLQDNPAEEVDSALEKRGLRRQVALTLPHFTVAPALLAGTDLVLTIAERTLERLRLPEELALCEPPLAIPRFDYVQIWRGDAEREAAGAWLREQIQAAARKI
ncbi:LysR family transcriptional regulator [Pseudomonas aeruginosa]|uniref:LysR family transcriptional regulator n=1 Tax=Pseudomonas aeruginosa TaxID=287 RepID=UPI0030032502